MKNVQTIVYKASINRSLWTDPDGEWEGSQEFYYRFVCTEFVENTNVWLGKDNGSGWQNNGYSILEQGPGNISLPGHNFQVSDGQAIIVYFTFYEADFLWWDDFIQEHKLVKSEITVEPYPNQYYTYPNPGNNNKVNAQYAPR